MNRFNFFNPRINLQPSDSWFKVILDERIVDHIRENPLEYSRHCDVIIPEASSEDVKEIVEIITSNFPEDFYFGGREIQYLGGNGFTIRLEDDFDEDEVIDFRNHLLQYSSQLSKYKNYTFIHSYEHCY